MKIYKWLMSFIVLGYMPFTWAQICNDCYSCEDYLYDMQYHVYADYLYWKTFRSAIGFGLGNSNQEDDIYLDPDYTSGYRVGGRVVWNCLDFGVRYTSYDSTTKQFILLLAEGSDNTKYRVDFQTVDIELGYLFCFNCGNNFLRPFVGAKLAWIDERVRFIDTILGQSIFFRNKLNDRGYGPYLGVEGKLGFFNWCNTAVGLRGRGSFGLLNGSQKAQITSSNLDGSFDEENHLISVIEVFVGLDLSYCDFSCFDLNLQIGYELQNYLRDSLTFGQQILFFDSIGFGGLVVRFGVYF